MVGWSRADGCVRSRFGGRSRAVPPRRRRGRRLPDRVGHGSEPTRRAGPDALRRTRGRSAASTHPSRSQNSYPHAFEQFAQLFDHPSAPDLCVIHSASHNWADQGGHLGEHGSLGVVQARAPFIVAGAGVPRLGMADIGCRLIDVAPTMLRLLAADRCRRPSAPLPPGRDGDRCPRRRPRPGPAPDRVPLGRDQPQRALRPGRSGRSPERGALDRRGDGLPVRCAGVAPDRHPGQPHHDPDRKPPRPPRDPPQRLGRPADRCAGDHQLAGDVGDLPCSGSTQGSRPCTTRPSACVRDHRLNQRALRRRGRLLDVRPRAQRRAAVARPRARRPTRRDHTVRPAEQGLPLGVAHGPHRRRAVPPRLGRRRR